MAAWARLQQCRWCRRVPGLSWWTGLPKRAELQPNSLLCTHITMGCGSSPPATCHGYFTSCSQTLTDWVAHSLVSIVLQSGSLTRYFLPAERCCAWAGNGHASTWKMKRGENTTTPKCAWWLRFRMLLKRSWSHDKHSVWDVQTQIGQAHAATSHVLHILWPTDPRQSWVEQDWRHVRNAPNTHVAQSHQPREVPMLSHDDCAPRRCPQPAPATARSPTSRWEDKCFHDLPCSWNCPPVWVGAEPRQTHCRNEKAMERPNLRWQVFDQDRKLYNLSIQRSKGIIRNVGSTEDHIKRHPARGGKRNTVISMAQVNELPNFSWHVSTIW